MRTHTLTAHVEENREHLEHTDSVVGFVLGAALLGLVALFSAVVTSAVLRSAHHDPVPSCEVVAGQ